MMCERDEEGGKGGVWSYVKTSSTWATWTDTELGRASRRNSAQLRKPKRWDLTEIVRKCKCKNIFLAMPGNSTGIHILSHIHWHKWPSTGQTMSATNNVCHRTAADTTKDNDRQLSLCASRGCQRLAASVSPIHTSPKQPCPSFRCMDSVSLGTSQASRPRPMVSGVELGQAFVR